MAPIATCKIRSLTFPCSDFRVRAVTLGMAKVIALDVDRVRRATAPAAADGAWGAISEALWPAWNGMLGAEARVLDVFGEMLGEKLLVLWALSRFGDGSAAGGTLSELIDESGKPRFGDWLAEDMLTAAFSLGVAWASQAEPGPRSARHQNRTSRQHRRAM